MTKFSIIELKKELDQKTKKELLNEISTICKKFPQVKEYYQAQYADSLDVLEKFQDRAHQIVKDACEAWGHNDTLSEIYEEYYLD